MKQPPPPRIRSSHVAQTRTEYAPTPAQTHGSERIAILDWHNKNTPR